MHAARQVVRALVLANAMLGTLVAIACGGSGGDSAGPTGPGGGGGGATPAVWTPTPGVHVNPADPTLLTAHDSAGNLVDVIGDRAADGTPTAIRGWRRYDPANPKAADVVTLGANRLPTSIGLRDGTTAALSYDTAGHVMLAVRTPDGQVRSTTFSWRPPPSVMAAAGDRSAPAPLLRQAASALPVTPRRAAGTTASTIPVTFQVAETPGGAAVTTASISGTWASRLTGGSFVAVASGVPGTYVAQVPSNPQLGVVTATQPFCNALNQISSATSVSAGAGVELGICGILDGGTSITGVGTLLQSQFLSAALLTACVALGPVSVATCTALAETLDAYCTAVATCETLSALNDAAALDAALSIDGVVQVGAIPVAASTTFNPATQTTPIIVQVPQVPARVTVTLAASSITVGQTVQATAHVFSGAGTAMPNEPVQWSILAGAAVVSPNGLVSPTGPGAVTVSATVGGSTGTASLSVQGTQDVPGALVASISFSTTAAHPGTDIVVTYVLTNPTGLPPIIENGYAGADIGMTIDPASITPSTYGETNFGCAGYKPMYTDSIGTSHVHTQLTGTCTIHIFSPAERSVGFGIYNVDWTYSGSSAQHWLYGVITISP